MLGRTLKMAFWVTYDHIGKLILANLMWSLVVFVPGLLGVTALLTALSVAEVMASSTRRVKSVAVIPSEFLPIQSPTLVSDGEIQILAVNKSEIVLV